MAGVVLFVIVVICSVAEMRILVVKAGPGSSHIFIVHIIDVEGVMYSKKTVK